MNAEAQPILGYTECRTCSWGLGGFCDGPRTGSAYLMQDPELATCLETSRRELMFIDTFKSAVEPTQVAQPTQIPPFIATARPGVVKIASGFDDVLFGISLGKIIGKRGNLSHDNVDDIKRCFGLPAAANLVLIGTGPDPRLEYFWKIHATHRTFERIAAMGFKWATSLTYSVWNEEFPRPEQLRNQQRNYYSYDAFTSSGLPCVPFLFLIDDADFRTARQWLEDRPEISVVAVYARFLGSETGYHKLREYLVRLQRMAPRPLTFLVCGIARPRNIDRLRYEFDARFENSHLFAELMNHKIARTDLRFEASSLDQSEILRLGLERHQAFCEPERPLIYLANPVEVNSEMVSGLS